MKKPLHSLSKHIVLATVFVFAAAIYFTQGKDIEFSGIVEHLKRLTYWDLAFCFSLALSQVAFQSSRLWMMLAAAGAPLSWLQVFRSFSFGQFINDFMPARAGDVAKVAFLRRTARDKTITLTKIAGSVFVADKLADVCALLFWSSVGGRDLLKEKLQEKDIEQLLYILAIIGAVGCVLIIGLYLKRETRVVTSAVIAVRSIVPFLRSKYMAAGLLFALGAWLMEIVNVTFLSAAVGYEISFWASLAVIILLNIGIAIPVSFANVGIFEAAMAFGLTRAGVPIGAAIAIASVHHLIQVVAVVVSAVAMWLWRTPFLQENSLKAFAVTPDDKERAVKHYESNARYYNIQVSRGLLRFLRERERVAILSFAELDRASSRTMIDVGCGGGFYALAAKEAGLRVCAVDIAPTMIERIKDKVDQAYVSDMESLKTELQYDIVVCSGALDFVLNPEKAFRNLSSLVAPGGKLIIQVPRDGLLGWVYRLEKQILKIRVNLFSLAWFKNIAHQTGLTLAGHRHPLPTNMVVCFVKPGSP